jgi:predicted amidohydrolase YtcJ
MDSWRRLGRDFVAGEVLPSRWDLDEVSGGHPVFLDRVDGHIAVANTRALQLASITLASRDPQGGQIDRDEMASPPAFCGKRRSRRCGV